MMLPTLAQKHQVKSIKHERLTVDARYDAVPDKKAETFMTPYRMRVDSVMAPVVGKCARDMRSERPESEMPNLLADILAWSAWHDYNEKVDFALYNIGGIRAVFSAGDIRIGDVVDVAPFENKICFLTLKGSDVTELFQQIARRGGEGVSGAIRCTISNKGELLDLTINNQPVDPEKEYRLATIDYLIEGNDGMMALRKGTNIIAPKEEKNDTRFIIMDYFREKAMMGEAVDAKIEGRIKVL